MDIVSPSRIIRTAVLAVVTALLVATAAAETRNAVISSASIMVVGEKLPAIGFVDTVGSSCGQVTITDNRYGQDFLDVALRCLKPVTKYSLVLTQSPTVDALPAQLISEFSSDYQGTATISLTAEVVDAFGTANQFLADGQGIADIAGAGQLANGAGTIPLDWFRIYGSVAADVEVQSGGGTVFGHKASVRGGALALLSSAPIPNPPLLARLDGDAYVAQFETKELADQNIGGSGFASAYAMNHFLSAESSTGDIAKFALEQLGGPPVTVSQYERGHFVLNLPIDRNHAGETITWRLTAIGRSGARSTATLTQTIARSLAEGPLQAQLPAVYVTYDRGGMYCRCTGNIVSYRWEVLGGLGLTETKLFASNSRSLSLNFAAGDVYDVALTVTDANGATSRDVAHVMAVSSVQYGRETQKRFSVLAQ